MSGRNKRKAIFRAALAGGVLVAAAGAALVGVPWGDHLLSLGIGGALARHSYDVPFAFRSGVPDEMVMVYVDAGVKAGLREPKDQPLDRKYYAQLLRRLKTDDARLVLFDFTFDEPSKDKSVDQVFANALKGHGRVVLVADYVQQLQGNSAACLLYTSPSPRDGLLSRMPSSA